MFFFQGCVGHIVSFVGGHICDLGKTVQWVNDGEYKYPHYQCREVFPVTRKLCRHKPTVTMS
jgi:hypothetical protein